MKSIRRRLTVWLLGGLAILWLAAGAGVYVSVQQSLVKSVDAELAVDARIVRFAARGEEPAEGEPAVPRGRGTRLQDRMPAYDDPGGSAFFQMWNAAGEVVEKSASLGGQELAFPNGSQSEPFFETTRLGDGREVRTMSFRVASGGKGPGKGKGGGGRFGSGGTTTVLAKDLSGVENTLTSLLGGVAIVGVIAAAGAILLVGAALNLGLKPLRDLGEQTQSIDADSLDARFDAAAAPAELRPVYERLNELIDRLETSFDRERRFSADLAHEMRTPVAELRMLSEMALKWPDQAGAATHTEALQIACRLESMIENLLALARWESGELALKKEPVELSSLLRECWEPHAKTAEEKKVEIRFEFGPNPPILETDPELLRHIAGNLLSNAAEYTPEGGFIRVGADPDGVEFSNSAPDLVEAKVARLFDRYWRADGSRTGTSHAGLGLTLAKSCADVLGLSLSARLQGGVLHFLLKKPAP